MNTQIIGEIGVNHQGDFGTLQKLTAMIFGAYEDGVNVVKVQLRTPEVCVPKDQWEIPKQTPWGTIEPYIEYRRKMELDTAALSKWDRYVTSTYGKHRWSASVWDVGALERLMQFDVPWIKIPSCKITDLTLLSAAKQTGKPIIMSTGMSTSEEIDNAVKIFGLTYAPGLRLLSCNSAYPTTDSEVNLRRMATLKERYARAESESTIQIGFSSHSASPYPTIYAALLGAESVEVHCTLSRTLVGSDHAASLEAKGLELLCREIRRIPVLMGNGEIKVYPSELPAREKLRGN